MTPAGPGEPRSEGDGGDGAVLASARTVSILTLASRLLGLLRDQAMASLLGNAWVHDALLYAWTVPNAFRRLFGEGALGSAFVPIFTRSWEHDGRDRARQITQQLLSAVATFLVLLSVVLMLLVSLVPPEWVSGWAAFAEPERGALFLWLVRLLLPYLAVICVIAQMAGVLNARGRFAVPAAAPILLNTVWIGAVGLAAWWKDDQIEQVRIIAWAILGAAVVQFVWHLPALRAVGVPFRFVRPRRSPQLSELAGVMGPMLLGMGAAQINVLVDRTVAAAALAEGGTTHLYYGMRVMQFPMGLVAVALGTAVYPALARLAARRDAAGMSRTASLALRTNLLMGLPAAVGLLLLAAPVVQLLFQRGRFGADATALTTEALSGYALGIPFAGLVILLTRASFALGDVRSPVRVGLAMAVVNAVLDLALVGPLGEFGLGLATSITAALSAALLLYGLRRRLEVPVRALVGGWVPMLLSATVMGLAVAALDAVLVRRLGPGTLGLALRVTGGIGVGGLVFGLIASRLCRREWGEISRFWTRPRG